MSASRPCGHLCPGFADIRSGPGPLFSGLTKFASRSRICFHLHRAFTVARPHRHPGTAAARHPHPFAPFTAHSARKGFALRLAVSPLRLRLFTGLVCRHGAGNPVWPHYTGDKHAQISGLPYDCLYSGQPLWAIIKQLEAPLAGRSEAEHWLDSLSLPNKLRDMRRG